MVGYWLGTYYGYDVNHNGILDPSERQPWGYYSREWYHLYSSGQGSKGTDYVSFSDTFAWAAINNGTVLQLNHLFGGSVLTYTIKQLTSTELTMLPLNPSPPDSGLYVYVKQ